MYNAWNICTGRLDFCYLLGTISKLVSKLVDETELSD